MKKLDKKPLVCVAISSMEFTKMKMRLLKIWKDPVASNVIANLLWLILLAVGTSIYLLFQKIYLSISFEESWSRILIKLNEERVITNWHYLIAFLIAVILLINRRVILSLIGVIIKSVFVSREFYQKYEYNFTNYGIRSSSIISSEKSFNIFKIKPQNDSKDWSLKILFSHNYAELEKVEKATETSRIFKKYGENILRLETYKKDNQEKINIDLLDNYMDQEFDLHFELSLENGGIIFKISRHGEELYVSDVKFGCSYFKIVAEDSHLDFDLKIKHERLE